MTGMKKKSGEEVKVRKGKRKNDGQETEIDCVKNNMQFSPSEIQ